MTLKTARLDARAGAEYGHIPGHTYHDVDVTCAADGSDAEAIETWGSAQGYDEEHGRNEVSASSLHALQDAAERAGWDESAMRYLATAITRLRRAVRESAALR